MLKAHKPDRCTIICWAFAVLAGLLALWGVAGDVMFFGALLLGAAIAAFLGLAVTRIFCRGESETVMDTRPEPGTPDTETQQAVAQQAVAQQAVASTAGMAAVASSPATQASLAFQSGRTDKNPSETTGDKGKTAKDKDTELASPAEKGGAQATKGAKPAEKGGSSTSKDAKLKQAKPAIDGGTRPKAMEAPGKGDADDLKEIKGVGPKLEQLCHELGIYKFSQIAGWGADEVAWMDTNLKGFRGRVSRDNWPEQAKILSAGGETEFSKRAHDGDVY